MADQQCYEKAVAKGESTFTLRSQDYSAPSTVAYWILKNIGSAPEEKLRDALEKALLMRKWPQRKWPD